MILILKSLVPTAGRFARPFAGLISSLVLSSVLLFG